MTELIDVRFDNLDKELQVPPGTTLLEAAALVGINMPQVCGRNANCGTCLTTVLSGEVSAVEADERATLDVVGEHHLDRLACRASVLSGPVLVEYLEDDW